MRFCPWYAASEIAARAPAGPAVFQVKIARGLIDYPSGKSAMVRYGAASDLGAALAELAGQHAGAELRFRHAEGLAPADLAAVRAALAALLEGFRRRFGEEPHLP